MNHCGTKEITTERLLLRRFTIDDAEDMYRNLNSDAEVNHFLTWELHTSVDETVELLKTFEERYESPSRYCWAIVLRETDEVIGTVAAPVVKERTEIVEVTYALGRAWWGMGITAEALKAVIEFLFTEVGVNRIEAAHDINNPNSGKVMEKAGMRKEGVLRKASRNNQGLIDIAIYAILRDEWEARQNGSPQNDAESGQSCHGKAKVYFVRHGETVWNSENKICGATDSPLTGKGREQAREVAEKVREMDIKADCILYSPLSRAKDTAMCIADATGLPAREEPRLFEQNFGIYESTARDGAEFRESKKQFASRYGGHGESMLHLAQRVYNLLDELKAQPDKTYILVAHNGIARVVQSYFFEMTNDEYAAFGIKNCEVREYEFPAE